jgi:hypothetical protein
VVERLPIRLRITQEELERYTAPKGINFTVLQWEKPDVAVIEFGCSEIHPDPIYRKSAEDLATEVRTTFRNRILTDNLYNYAARPRRFLTLSGVLEHPHFTRAGTPRDIKRAAEAATDVHDIEMTKEQVEYMEDTSGVPRGSIEPKETRRRRKQIPGVRDAEGRIIGAEQEGPLEMVYVYTAGVVDTG